MLSHICPERGMELVAEDKQELFTLSVRHFSEEHLGATVL